MNHVSNEELCIAHQGGCRKSLDLLMERNIPLVKQRANRAKRAMHLEFDELVSVGWLAMRKAADTWTVGKGRTFASHAYINIDARIAEYVDKSRMNGMTGYSKNKLASIPTYTRIADDLAQQWGRPVSVSEAAAHVGNDADEIPTSLSTAVAVNKGDDGNVEVDSLFEHVVVEDFDGQVFVEQIIAMIPEHNRSLVTGHVFHGRSLASIGKDEGVSREATSRRFQRQMKSLRETVEV